MANELRQIITADSSGFIRELGNLNRVSNRELNKLGKMAERTSNILANMSSQLRSGDMAGFAQGIGGISLQLRGMVNITTKAVPALKGIGTAVNAALGPLGAAITIISTGIKVVGGLVDAVSSLINKEDDLKQRQEEINGIMQDFSNAVGSNAGSVINKFNLLKKAFDDYVKNGKGVKQFTNDFSDALEDCGINGDNLNEVNRVFTTDVDDFKNACMAKAQALAAMSIRAKEAERYISALMEITLNRGESKWKIARGGTKASSLTEDEAAHLGISRTAGNSGYANSQQLTEAQLRELNRYRKQKAYQAETQTHRENNAALAPYENYNAVKNKPKKGGRKSSGGSGGDTKITVNTKALTIPEMKRDFGLPIDDKVVQSKLDEQARRNALERMDKNFSVQGKVSMLPTPVSPMSFGEDATKFGSEKWLAKAGETAAAVGEKMAIAARSVGDMANALEALGASSKELKAGAIIAQAVAQLALAFAQASMSEAKSGVWSWIAASVSGLATLLTMSAQLKNLNSGGYATGGIVGGNSYFGDRLTANVNSGEMILNKRQQSNLFNMIDRGTGAASSGTVVFEIAGSNLKGVLRNYDQKINKF